MKKALTTLSIVIVICLGIYVAAHVNKTQVQEEPIEETTTQTYASSTLGISVVVPKTFLVNEKYAYDLVPGKQIQGVKFTIDPAMATGTNLSTDTYISVESQPNAKQCTATLFLDGIHPTLSTTEGRVTYSVASSSGAGAGNRYEETVYALQGTNPCVAVRYFVHYGVIQNYPEGTVTEFDNVKLMNVFDGIRSSLIVNQ
jgi:hypothetical protein